MSEWLSILILFLFFLGSAYGIWFIGFMIGRFTNFDPFDWWCACPPHHNTKQNSRDKEHQHIKQKGTCPQCLGRLNVVNGISHICRSCNRIWCDLSEPESKDIFR